VLLAQALNRCEEFCQILIAHLGLPGSIGGTL
jgi:hypothetical protein